MIKGSLHGNLKWRFARFAVRQRLWPLKSMETKEIHCFHHNGMLKGAD